MSNLITVSVNILEMKSFLKALNPEDNLSKIREILSCDKTILFLQRKNGNLIELEDEGIILLKEIITIDNRNENSIYLKKTIYWDILNESHKLDYGRTISDEGTKVAKKRAFKIKNFSELKESNKCKKGTIEVHSTEELIKSRNLFFSTGINIRDLISIELSNQISRDEIFKNGKKLTYNYTQVDKLSLKLCKDNLEPTKEFINAIEDIIKSENPSEGLKKVIEDYGLFIPTEIIMGGKFYSNDTEMSSRHIISDTNEGQITGRGITLEIGGSYSASRDKTTFYKATRMETLGGNTDGVFDENKWTESLKDYQNWDCIEFKNPISIFQLLPDNLRNELIKSVGKKILYIRTVDFEYCLKHPGDYGKFTLNDKKLSNVFQNEEIDCDIFATVVDTDQDSKNVFFNCQILEPKAKLVNPSIIIHGIQRKFQQCKYKLKIVMMVIGYDIYFKFTFSNIANIELIRKEYKSKEQDDNKFDSITLKTKCDLKGTNYPFFGISILNSLESPGDSLVIGHSFHNIQSDHELKVDIFPYCSKVNRYCNLPNFTFCTLIILDANAYDSFHFKFSMFNKLKKPFINLSNLSHQYMNNPKYVSLLLYSKDNYKPFFLKQTIGQIKINYVDCNCGKTCFICKNKKIRISKNDGVTCMLLDPYTFCPGRSIEHYGG